MREILYGENRAGGMRLPVCYCLIPGELQQSLVQQDGARARCWEHVLCRSVPRGTGSMGLQVVVLRW